MTSERSILGIGGYVLMWLRYS